MIIMFKKITSTLSTLYISIFTSLKGRKVGTDQFGNTYYVGKPRTGQKRERRWVIFNGQPEATKIPPLWHGWVHHQSDLIPDSDNHVVHKWQKEHTPNLTGTPYAYVPPGHALKKGKRPKVTGDYQAWKPK